MSSSPQVTVRRVNWADAGAVLREVRRTVFVAEQNVPEELEWDGRDEDSLHVLAQAASGSTIGTGRLLPDGHIGRMAVVKEWRGRGVGGRILRELMNAAVERRHAAIELSAQTHAIGFYRRFGFEVAGDEYLDAGIPHRTMRLSLITPRRG